MKWTFYQIILTAMREDGKRLESDYFVLHLPLDPQRRFARGAPGPFLYKYTCQSHFEYGELHRPSGQYKDESDYFMNDKEDSYKQYTDLTEGSIKLSRVVLVYFAGSGWEPSDYEYRVTSIEPLVRY